VIRFNPLRAVITRAVAVVYLLWNLLAWYISTPTEMGDTYRYFGFLIFDAQNPGIMTSFLYQSIQDPRIITLIQVVLATIAFLVLVSAVLIQTKWRAAGIIASALVLLVSMTAPFWSWQTLLATEGLTLSFSVLWLAAVIMSFNRELRPAVVITALSVSATLLLLARPQFVVLVLPASLLIGFALSRRTRSLAVFVDAVAGVIPAVAFSLWRLLSLMGDKGYSFIYTMHNYVDKASTFRAYANERMPSCEPLTAAMNGPAPWSDMAAIRDQLISLCPESFLWLKSGPVSVLNWTTQYPAESLTSMTAAMSDMIISPYSPMTATPPAVSSLILPEVPAWMWLAAAWLIGIGLAFIAGYRSKPTRLTMISTLVMAGCFAVLIYFTWASDGIELARHQAPWILFAIVAGLTVPVATARSPRPSKASFPVSD
jgi:uncharacterized membrane protein